MELKFGLLADYIGWDQQGKLIIAGEFEALEISKLPARHGRLMMVVRFEGHVSEGTDHHLQIGLYDEDDREILPLTREMPFKMLTLRPGRPLRGQVIVALQGIEFKEYGDHEFRILVDGEHKGSIPLFVLKFSARPQRSP